MARPVPMRFLKQLKEEQIRTARETLFGVAGTKAGDRHLLRPLDGNYIRGWYYPSRFGMQDFSISEYYEMQAERFAPRQEHRAMKGIEKASWRAVRSEAKIRTFLSSLSEEQMKDHPTMRDLRELSELAPEVLGLSGATALPSGLDDETASQTVVIDEGFSQWRDVEEIAALMKAVKDSGKIGNFQKLYNEVAAADSLEQARKIISTAMLNSGFEIPWARRTVEVSLADAAPSAAHSAEAPVAAPASVGTISPSDYRDFEEDEDTEVVAAPKRGRAHRAINLRIDMAQQTPASQKAMEAAQKDLERIREQRNHYTSLRHRYVDPLFRRRRLKWLERLERRLHKEIEIKQNSYFIKHPDEQEQWPVNKGSTWIRWPSPYV